MPTNESAAELMRGLSEDKQAADGSTDKRWRWASGTILFPEGQCCYCKAPVRCSDRLWRVENGWLRGQLRFDGMFAVMEKPEHPHSGSDGGLCLGNTDDPTSALFFGINPHDPIQRGMDIKAWYAKMFKHVCGEGEALKPMEGLFVAPAVPERGTPKWRAYRCPCGCCSPRFGACGCGCDGCICDNPDDEPEYVCHVCGAGLGEDDVYFAYDAEYCNDCFSNGYRYCESCSDPVSLDEAVRDDDNECFYHPGCTPAARAAERERQRERTRQLELANRQRQVDAARAIRPRLPQ